MFAASKTAAPVASSTGDPYWNNVSLLTNFENNLAFQDGSTNNLPITVVGTVTPNLNTPFSGVGGSIFFGGAAQYLTFNGSSSAEFGTGAYTIEGWFFLTNLSGTRQIFDCRPTDSAVPWGCEFVSGAPSLYNGASNTSSSSVTINTWNHVAFVREGTGANQARIYINGAVALTFTDSVNYGTMNTAALIGRNLGNVNSFAGVMSNLRIVKGNAIYTSAFTPPTTPLTAVSGTSLLITGTGQGMFNNSTFVDQGPNALTVTATGGPLYSGRSPFGNTYPGSVRFSGSTQYLTVPNNTGFDLSTGNFTIEAWVNISRATGFKGICSKLPNGFGPFLLAVNGTSFVYYLSTNGISWNLASGVSGGTVAVETWNHVALVRNGSTFRPYLNGVAGTTITSATALSTNTAAVAIGADGYGGSYVDFFAGHISNLRIVKGTALYTSNFTPSTTPLTAVTNTSLLVRGDTGAFYDLSNNGNPESNTGTTAVTTQIKKYGIESASYTATAYQTVSDAANLQLGAGDYTIEMWVYRNAAGVLHSLACKGAAATGWLLQINSSNQLVFTVTSTAILTSTTTIGATTWAFVTVTRSGTSTRLFVNGNLEATATNSTNFTQTDALKIGADRSNANGLNGHLDDIRITKGVARYTASFAPPTQTFPTGP
jgi:hypothetical protein